MRWGSILSGVLFMALALAPVHGATLQQEYLDIYIKLSDSERLEKVGDFRGALEGFEDCYNRLNKIHRTNPEWEHVLVSSRMEDCKAKIAELEPRVEQAGGSAPVAPPIGPSGAQPPVVNPTSTSDAASMKARLQEVENQLAATKAQLADVSEKYKNSQLQVQALHTQLDTVNQQLAQLKNGGTVDQNMGQLMAQNKTLTDKLAAAQREIKSLAGSPNSKASKLVAQLKAVQDKLTETQAANQALTDTTNTLQSQLNQAQNDLAAANAKLATAAPGSPEYLTLKRENEVMRSILSREILEQSRRDGAKRLAQEEFDRLKINSKVLQEQLDILASPMVPPSSDEERTLLASLKAGNGGVMPLGAGGNQLAATTNGAPVQEGNPPGPIAPPNATPPATTNAVANPPAPEATNAVANATPPTPPPPPATNAVPATDTNTAVIPATTATNTPAATPPTPPPANANPPAVTADTNAAPATNAAPTASNPPPMPPAPATNAAPAVTADTNAAPATNTAPVAATNAAPAPATATNSVASTDTNPPAPATNTAPASDNGAAPASSTPADPNRYSYKPRLPDDMREIAQEATDLFKMQRYDEAAAKYQMIIDKYPESLYAWSNLGVVRSQEGKLPEAQKALQQAVKLSPNDAFSYRNLGIVYYQLNRNDEAIDALERSIALDPNNVYSHDYLGCATSQKGWQEVAEKEFRKAIEINDDFPDAHYNLAIIYAMQKPPSLELARRHYKRALELGLPKDMRLEKLLGL